VADDPTAAQSTKDTVTTSVPVQSPALLTIPQFASGIKRRIPELQSIPDAIVARRALESHPELIHSIRTFEPRGKLKKQTAPEGSPSETEIRTILGNRRFEDLPLAEKAHVLSLGFQAYAQREQYKAADSANWMARASHWVKSLLGETGGVAIGAEGGLADKKNAAITATGIVDPAIPAVVFGTQAAAALPRQIRQARAHPTPENVQAPLLGASMVAGGAAGALEGAQRAAPKVKEAATVTAQRAIGAGPRLAEQTAKSMVEDVSKHNVSETEKFASRDADYQTKITRINEDFDEKIAKARQEHGDNVAARDRKAAELQGQHAEKVAQARAEWVRKAYESRQAGREAAASAARREALEHGQQAYTKLVDDNVKSTHTAVRGSLDERWNSLREKVGVDTPVQAPPLYTAVESARAMLAGVPADLKIFNDIVKEITEKGGKVETESGELRSVPKESIPFDDARTQYSAIGEKAYSAEGNLRRALFTLYDAYDKSLNATAESAGAGKEYTALKSDWKQYMQDWHDMRSQATGGSPLARLYRADPLDTKVISGQVLSKFSNRLIETFARYNKYGAAPALMAKLRNYNALASALPRVKVPNAPSRLVPPAPPAEPAPIAPVEPQLSEIESARAKKLSRTELPAPPDIKPNPTVDDVVAKLREAKIEKAKEAREKSLTWTKYDTVLGGISLLGPIIGHNIGYAIPYTVARFGEMALVNSEFGQNWLSRVTPQDIKVINEVLDKAPEERAPVTQAVTDGLAQRVRHGDRIPPLSTFQTVLSKEQIGKVMRAATGSPASKSPTPTASPAAESDVEMARRVNRQPAAASVTPADAGNKVPEDQRASIQIIQSALDDLKNKLESRGAAKQEMEKPKQSQSPPAPPGTQTAEGAKFDNSILKRVQSEHPEWTLSQQLQEAARRANKARGK
jgi:hypothetical protein